MVVMVAAVMAVVHMAACMAVPPPAWPPALPSRTFVLVLVLVLVLGDSAIGDANGALGRGRFWATAPPPSAPFRFPNPSCSRMAAACELNPSVASAKYQPVSINHATNLNLNFKF